MNRSELNIDNVLTENDIMSLAEKTGIWVVFLFRLMDRLYECFAEDRDNNVSSDMYVMF